MGSIIINGKRFDGNKVAIRGGKVVIDGKVQTDKLGGKVDLQVTDGNDTGTHSVASVKGGDARNTVVRAAAHASVGGAPKNKKR